MTANSISARGSTSCMALQGSDRANSISVSPIKKMEVLAAAMEGVVSLGQGTPSFNTPAHIREFVRQKISEGITDKYALGPGIAPLRQAVAEKLLSENGIDADPSAEILITVGASEALAIAVLALVNPGDEVVVTTPGYAPHLEQIRLAGGMPVYVPLREDNNWEFDVDALRSAISRKTKAIVISTPVNPTGSVISRSVLTSAAQIAFQHQLLVISDETYEDFVYDEHRHFSIASMPEMKELVISVYSFSKSYAMTGWRCGYVHAPAGIMNQLLKIHDAFCICAPLTAQYAGWAALTGPQDCINQFRHEFLLRRQLVMERLSSLSRFTYVRPQGAYYILARIKDLDDPVSYCLDLLRDTKVVLVPGSAFGPTACNHVRISFCMSDNIIKEAFDRIQEFENRK